jgi:polyhydroxyalkanoate synthesis regulator phasin
VSDVLDALRGYVQLATGLTEVTVSKAREAAAAVIAQGIDLAAASRDVPGGDTAKAAASQVQELADDLLENSKQNREMLTGLVRTEVDRAAGRMGFVREEELAAVRRHVSRLETQLADIRAAMGASGVPASDKAAADASAAHAVDAAAASVAAGTAPASRSTTVSTPDDGAGTSDAPAPKPAKKKVPVAKPAATDAS